MRTPEKGWQILVCGSDKLVVRPREVGSGRVAVSPLSLFVLLRFLLLRVRHNRFSQAHRPLSLLSTLALFSLCRFVFLAQRENHFPQARLQVLLSFLLLFLFLLVKEDRLSQAHLLVE